MYCIQGVFPSGTEQHGLCHIHSVVFQYFGKRMSKKKKKKNIAYMYNENTGKVVCTVYMGNKCT